MNIGLSNRYKFLYFSSITFKHRLPTRKVMFNMYKIKTIVKYIIKNPIKINF